MSKQVAPRKGANGIFHSPAHGDIKFVVDHVDGRLCLAKFENDPGRLQPFIWRFKDGLNTMHDWDGKDEK